MASTLFERFKVPLFVLLSIAGTILVDRSGKGAPNLIPVLVSKDTVKDYPIYSSTGPNGMYLDLMKLTLTDLIYQNDKAARIAAFEGRGWPSKAFTMIGMARLNNLQKLVEDVLSRKVPGDLIEAGAWRGGATIFMRALLKANSVEDRFVWVADSFEGLPPPDLTQYPADADSDLDKFDELAVSLEQVKENFARYGLLDDNVKFLKGWFKDTLPSAPIEKLAILRIDADMYESTMDALKGLYDKVSVGGYVIIDDYGSIPACKKSVDDFRVAHNINSPIQVIDDTGIYWQKSASK